MERIGTDHMKGTENMTTLKDWSMESAKKDVSHEYEKKDIASTGHYDKVSKDGDTLEISKNGGIMLKRESPSGEKQVSVAELISASEAKLKQLYSQKQITKQQYDKYMKQKSAGNPEDQTV